MKRRIFLVGLGLILVGGTFVFGGYWQYVGEKAAIQRFAVSSLNDIVAGAVPYGTVRGKALAMQAAVQRRVGAGGLYSPAERPFLRHTAWETLVSGQGACGEVARVMVNLFRALGIPASRVVITNDAGFNHTAMAYEDGGKWYLLHTIKGREGFEAWTRAEPRRLKDLVRTEYHDGGGLLINAQNPYFTRYSYFNWARVFGAAVEINQLDPFPGFVVEIIENPPLLLAILRAMFVALVVAGLALVPWPLLLNERQKSAWRPQPSARGSVD